MKTSEQERALPEYTIEGTVFLVDIMKEEFRQKDNHENVISFGMLVRENGSYRLIYDAEVKNIPGPDRYNSPALKTIDVPQLAQLDPEGMAEKCNKPIEQVRGKTDFEVIVDQELLAKRMSGQLPTIELMGHTFYVDVFMGAIRPKDDFSTMGIAFSDMEAVPFIVPEYYRFYYDPAKHSLGKVDVDTVTDLPKNIVVMEIPLENKLDPFRFAQIYGFDVETTLMRHPIRADMKGRVVPWEETGLPRIIEENKNRFRGKRAVQGEGKRQKANKRKGRGI